MAFVYDELLAPAYAKARFDLMTDLWGDNLKPYVDKFGIARIGPNIGLVDSMDALVHTLLGDNYDPDLVDLLTGAANQVYAFGDSDKLRKNLNKVLNDWVEDHDLPNKFKIFDFDNKAHLREALPGAMQPWEDLLPPETGIPDSDERTVLISLIQEGVDIGNILTYISDFERVNAWYELRYLSNGGFEGFPPPSKAIAERRYHQSDIFQLYNDPDNVDLTEAEEVGVVYTRNRVEIRDYENQYDPGRGDIISKLQPAIHAVADFYSIDIGRIEELLFTGRFTGYDGQTGNLEDKRHDSDLIIGGDGVDTLIGGAGNDTILGDTQFSTDSQADTLEGGAGNDRLYGGGDVDVLRGGGGNDHLWGGGDAGDQLIGGAGNDTYYLTNDASTVVGGHNSDPDPSLIGGLNDDDIVEAKNGGTDTVVIWVASGDFPDLRNIERFKLAADISGTVSVMLNEFDDFVLSTGDDALALTINKLQKTPIDIKTNGGADTISIFFEPGVDPSQVLDGKGLTARFRFSDLSANDTIDLTSIGIEDVVMKRDKIFEDKGFYLMAPGAKLDFMENGHIDKTYNNSTDSWFVVKCGSSTPYGPEFMGDIHRSHFDY